MGRKSTVKRLPPEILKEVNKLLSEGRATLDEILHHLRQLGVEDVSRSALGRYRQNFEEVAGAVGGVREDRGGENQPEYRLTNPSILDYYTKNRKAGTNLAFL